jgi:hypothetical protein
MAYIESSEEALNITPSYDAFADCQTYYWHVRASSWMLDFYSKLAIIKNDFHGTRSWPLGCPSSSKPPLPRLFIPKSGETITTLNPDLVWESGESTCEPGDYYDEVSGTPDITENIIGGATNATIQQEDLPFLKNCTHYYWRVTPRNDLHTTSSRIYEFWTDIGGCPNLEVCNPDQLEADTLIYPVGDEVVTDPRVYLVWKNNLPGCVPMMSYFVVSEHSDFSDHVISSDIALGGEARTDTTIFAEPFDVYQDGKTYTWKTRIVAAEGDHL